jgi:bifunctional UDP-N-acetylglucosamine pyrophosphorylase/glucosamine-1-phosphate N-acetyltransferase
MALRIIILAAGKGKRMVSNLPKVLHLLGGMPLLEHVINTANNLKPQKIYVVYGNGGSTLPQQMTHLKNVEWIHQDQQLGTGHAVMQAVPHCNPKDQILVLYGDVPLIPVATLHELIKATPHNGVGLVVTVLKDPSGFGRIIRNQLGNILSIVEDKDATPAQRKVKEINTGIISTTAKHLQSWLPMLKKDNKQNEYYLTDIIALANSMGVPVGGVIEQDFKSVLGVNDRWQLANMERHYQRSLARELAYSGVTVRDPSRLDIRGQHHIAPEVIIDINVVMEGKVKIGANSEIGPNVHLKNVDIGENVKILANSVIEGAKIADNCQIGPFARIRPDTFIHAGTKIGNFVEIKKSTIGEESKVNHLTYLGDATIGKNVNIGAGTITCNYDGINKFQTIIEDDVFIGSNSTLLAPIKIKKNAYIAAGSPVSEDVHSEGLTIARSRQTTIENWQRPKKGKKPAKIVDPS